jgi:excisionase family DNA binding protein
VLADGSDWMTRPEAAAYARVHPTTLSRAISRGELRAGKTSAHGHVRIRRRWVDAWLLGAGEVGEREAHDDGLPDAIRAV